jgi:outer membrane protein assembly factor BamB
MRSSTLTAFLIVLAASLLRTPSAPADDWPQYRGPHYDDISRENGLLKQWPKDGPKLLWTYGDTGVGYSSVAVVGDQLFTIGGRGANEFLIALDISGAAPKQTWATRVGPLFQFQANQWSSGPSATPTIDGDVIYALGGNGDLVCLNRNDGKEVWRKNLPSEMDAEVNPIGGGPKKLGWGFTWSPLVDGDRLICIPGGPKGTVAALDKKTGKALWRSTEATDQAAYTSPAIATIDGVRQYVVLTNMGVLGVAAEDGKLLWSHRRRYGTEIINTPIVKGNQVFITVGTAPGCELLKVEREGGAFKVVPVYASKSMSNHHGNVILLDKHIYGHSQGTGWTCIAMDTGEAAWAERGKLRSGALIYADERFYSLAENDGTVSLISADPKGWKEEGRFKLPKQSVGKKPKGGIWTPPVIANGKLFLRDQELLFCYDVKAP